MSAVIEADELDSLRAHLVADHDVSDELARTISDLGSVVLHEGAHTVGPMSKPRPDGVSPDHIRTGEGCSVCWSTEPEP